MRAVTYVIDGLDYGNFAKQLSLLAPATKASGRDVQVISLSGDGPFANAIRKSGISIQGRRGRRAIDLDEFRLIRRLIKGAGDSIYHVFGLSTFRLLCALGFALQRPRIILSLNGRERLSLIDRWLLRRCSSVTVPHSSAIDLLVGQGISPAQISVLPLAVEMSSPILNPEETRRSLGLMPRGPLIATASRMERSSDLFSTLWLFGYLHYLEFGVNLFVIGDGPSRMGLEHAVVGLSPEDTGVCFLGARQDAPKLMALAELVIIIKPQGGMNVALEAMAAGLPVFAADTMEMRSIVRHLETGFLVPIDAPREAARAIRSLLVDSDRRQRIANAARSWIIQRHHVSHVCRTLELLYDQ